ncbi:MAG: NUDIX hydrolase [Candidatus Woesearchaeota archaeon]
MIPKHAKKVFEGVLFRVYQWEQEMFDGSFETFEAIKRLPGVQIIAVKEDEFIFLKESQPHRGSFLSLSGGMFDSWNEDPLDAARRELLEETGFSGDFSKFMTINFGGKIDWPVHYFICKIKKEDKSKVNLDAGEKIKVQYEKVSNLFEFVNRDDFRNKQFKNYLNDLKNKGLYKDFLKKLI